MADENKWDQKDGNPEDDEEELDETVTYTQSSH